MKRCAVFLNGEYNYSQEFIDRQIDSLTVCLCADGGANYAFKYGKTPDLIVGDLDSIEAGVMEHYRRQGVKFEEHSPEKDFTDFELILQKIGEIERKENFKFSDIVILGGTGNRIDLTLSNLFLMEEYGNILFLTENEEIFYRESPFKVEGRKGYGFSIIPLDSMIEGLTLEGFRYPLVNEDIPRRKSRLVSNVVTSDRSHVSFTRGKMIVVLTFFKK